MASSVITRVVYWRSSCGGGYVVVADYGVAPGEYS